MAIKVAVTQFGPDTILRVGDAEFVDLSRQGFIIRGAGDVDSDGNLIPRAAKNAPEAATQATPVAPAPTDLPSE